MSSSKNRSYFFCGIGGSGMLPLAVIVKGLGYDVHGSDRSYDQGRTPEKFSWMQEQGLQLSPQDGSGITPDLGALVISTAVEDSIPDVKAAKEKNVPILKRAELLAEFFNRAKTRVAIAGTSGKTTTTGMTGFLLKEAGLDPIVMNGGIFRNYAGENPYATALVGRGDVFVTEADESDGSIALYHPDIAVLHNITLDHKPLAELKALFSDFIGKAKIAVLNTDDPDVLKLADGYAGRVISYSLKQRHDVSVSDILQTPEGISATVVTNDETAAINLQLPGRHNLSNALAAIAVGLAVGIPLKKSVGILSRFEGIKRRMEKVGVKNGITVIDDFAHNPDKVAATLSALKKFPGRLVIFFQPHGYGFLKLVKDELAQTFADHLDGKDRLYIVEPFYAGGTVDRSVGGSHLVDAVQSKGITAVLCENREDVQKHILADKNPQDRIVIMGARDDTLSQFAQDILQLL